MRRISYAVFVLWVIALGAVGVARLNFNVDLLKLLPRDLPGVAGTAAFQKFHDLPDELQITMQSTDGSDVGDLAEELAAQLAAVSRLARRVQADPAWRTAPGGLIELTAHAWLNARPEQLLELETALAPAQIDSLLQARLGAISESISPLTAVLQSRDPLGLGRVLTEALDAGAGLDGSDGFSTADGTFHLIKVKTGRPLKGYRETSEWLIRVREVVAAWQRSQPAAAEVKIAYTGSPAFEAEIGLGMEHDMSQSISGITFIVALLFWLLHRRIRPLFYLLLAMLVTGLLTLGVAGLTFGTLDVMSMGFAAILMGMVEDFGVMGLHAAMRRPDDGFRAIHAELFPSIAWSALTAAAVFASLGLSTLPGIARMGCLTALGILIGAAVMLYGFLPMAMRGRAAHPSPSPSAAGIKGWPAWPGALAAILTLLCVGALLMRGLPGIDDSAGVLRPRHCQAFETLLDLEHRLKPDSANTLWLPVILRADSPTQLSSSLRQLESRLTNAKAKGLTLGHLLPSAFTPDPTRQAANLPVLARLAVARTRLLESLDAAGFTAEGAAYSRGVLDIWSQWGNDKAPTTRWLSDQLLDDFVGPLLRRDAEGVMACGFVRLPNSSRPFESGILAEIQQDPCVQVGGWDYLTAQLKSLCHSEIKRVLLPALAVLGVLFFLVFRNARERLVAVGSLAFSGLLLLGVMSATGLAWNFVNIGTVPLVLGLGLDFNIHMIHALRERGADGHGIGRALAYCGLSTGLGFGALGLSDNGALATFGQTSMIGVLATLLTAAFFVPWVWRRLGPGSTVETSVRKNAHRLALLPLLAVVFWVPSCHRYSTRVVSSPLLPGQRVQASRNLKEEVDRLAKPLIESGEIYGMAVGVLSPDGTIGQFGYGGSGRPGDTQPPGGDAIFQIASVTKLFSTAVLAILVDEGQLRYEDTVRSILPPGVPLGEGVGDLTLHELVTHTAGIPRQPVDWTQLRYLVRYLFTGRNLYGFIDKPYLYEYLRSCHIKPKSKGNYVYSNVGIALMAHLIEIKTGKAIPDLVEEKICRPLKMKDTVFYLNAEQEKRLVVGHVGDQPKFLRRNTPMKTWDMGEIMRATGGMYSTVNDLMIFIRANMGSFRHPLEAHLAETRRVQIETPKEGVALGWLVDHLDSNRITLYYTHGMISGYSAYAGMNLDQKMAVVVLFSNFNWSDKIGHHLLLRLSESVPRSGRKSRDKPGAGHRCVTVVGSG
jgi:CubicO group peptidase (beta-lactamase class C family)/predicted exporter